MAGSVAFNPYHVILRQRVRQLAIYLAPFLSLVHLVLLLLQSYLVWRDHCLMMAIAS